jgi:hypothetical protein
MHGCMASMGIKQHPFRARPYTSPHFCGGSAHIGLLGGVKNKEIGARRTRGTALDLGATLAGSPSAEISEMSGVVKASADEARICLPI